jgi:hypothetical protein
MIFYAIYNNQGNHFTIGVTLLQGGPRKEKFLCNVVPGGGGRRGLAKFRRGSPGFGRGRAVEGSMGQERSVSLVGRGRGGSSERPRRRLSAPAAGLPAPARAWPGLARGRLGQLLGELGDVEGG